MAGVTIDKVKIFISSNCDSEEDKATGNFKYSVMRKSLALLLEETGICEVYVFEEGDATSYNVVPSFMEKLDISDLVIVIVDNKDGVGSGTQKEISRINALQKKAIYVFCDEREKRPTQLECELRNSLLNPRYCTVHEFADIAKKVFESVLNDIFGIYKSYCRGTVDFIDDFNQSIENNGANIEMSTAEDSDISKEIISKFVCPSFVVRKEAGFASGEKDTSSEDDRRCADLLGIVIGSSLTNDPDFGEIKADIKKMHKGNMQKLIGLRYEAVEAYFSGNLSECFEKLENAITFINKCKNIPRWLLNDVAIDLRNIQLDIDEEKGIINLRPDGQKILEEDSGPLYYPVIDRIVSDFSREVIKKRLNHAVQSPYAINIGGVDYMLEKACNAFIVAYYYGSITHMLMIRKYICDYLLELALEIRDHSIFMLVVRLLLLSGDEKMLRNFLSVYGENTNAINSNDTNILLVALNKQPISSKRILAREYMLNYFGYYYSDDTFDRESRELADIVKKRIKTDKSAGRFIKPLLDAMENTSYRFNELSALEFVYCIFEENYRRYYDDVFKYLYNFHFSSLTLRHQKQYQRFMINALSDPEIRNNNHNIYSAAQTLRKYEAISHKPLDSAVKRYNKSFYKNTYCLNIKNYGAEEGWKYTVQQIDAIITENLTQGKNGAYSDSAYNPYLTISNIVINDGIIYSSPQLKQIVEACKGTLLAKAQTLKAKVNALELLCILQLHQPLNRQIVQLYRELTCRREDILDAQNSFFSKGFSKTNIELNICLLGVILKQERDCDVGIKLVEIQNSEIAEQLTTLRFLDRLFVLNASKHLTTAINSLFQFLLNESYSANPDVRFYAISVLSKIKDKKYRDICLDRFINVMDNEAYKGKVGLLYRLDKNDLSNPKVNYIFEKGKADTHYWVRVAANRFDNK